MERAVNDLETTLYGPLVEGARLEGWKLFKIVDGSFGQKPGDIAGAAPTGRAVLLEVKSPRRRMEPGDVIPTQLFSAHQVHWLRAFAEVGALALVALWQPGARMALYRIRQPDDFGRLADYLWIGDLTVTSGLTCEGWNQLTLTNERRTDGRERDSYFTRDGGDVGGDAGIRRLSVTRRSYRRTD